MEKQFRIICLVTYFMIVPFASATFAQGENVRENATIFINYYNSKDFLGATSLFHFPADYTANELKEDKDAVSKTLNMYYEEFGRIASIERKDNVSLYYFVSIGGGNLPYWQKYPNTYNLFYKVNFSREGQGYVVLVFCYISDKWEIRQVNYGLPADRPESQERISGIFMKWVKLRGQ